MSILRSIGRIRKECINKSALHDLSTYVSISLISLNPATILKSMKELTENKHLVEDDEYCRGYAAAMCNILNDFHYRMVTAEKCHYEEASPYPSNRCQRVAGHKGDHKLSQDTGYAHGYVETYWKCGGCGIDIGPLPIACSECEYVTAYYQRELQSFRTVDKWKD